MNELKEKQKYEFLEDGLQEHEIFLLKKINVNSINKNPENIKALTKQIEDMITNNLDIKSDKTKIATIQLYWKIKWIYNWKLNWKYSQNIERILEYFKKDQNIISSQNNEKVEKLDITNWISEEEFKNNLEEIKKLTSKELLKNPKTFEAIHAQISAIMPIEKDKFIKTREEINNLVKTNPYYCILFQLYGKMIWINDRYELTKLEWKVNIKPIFNYPINWNRWEFTETTIKYLYDFWWIKNLNKSNTEKNQNSAKKDIKFELPSWYWIIKEITDMYKKSNLEKSNISKEDLLSLVFVESGFNNKIQSHTWSAWIFQITQSPVKDIIEKFKNWDWEKEYDDSQYNREMIIDNLFTDKSIKSQWKQIFAEGYDDIFEKYTQYINNKQLLETNYIESEKIIKSLDELKNKLNKKKITPEEVNMIKEKITKLEILKKELEKQIKEISKDKKELINKISKWLKVFLSKKNQFPINWNCVIGISLLENLARYTKDFKIDTSSLLENKKWILDSVTKIIWNKIWIDINGKKIDLKVDEMKFNELLTDIIKDKNNMKQKFNALRFYNGQNNQYSWEPVAHKNIYALSVLYISRYYKEFLPN